MNIVITDGYLANPGDLSWAPIESLGSLTVYDHLSQAEIIEKCREADAVFTNKLSFGTKEFEALPRLRFVGVLATGFNNIDVVSAREHNVTVCNVPSYSSASVAQTVFALLLEITNNVGRYSAEVEAGRWQHCDDFSFTLGPISELAGMTLGIYGLGNIGKQVAAIASAFGMRIISPTSQSSDAIPPYVTKVDFDEFLNQSDVISINCPLTASNRHLFNKETLAKTRPGVIIINTARGAIIDENALVEALKSGRVGAAGLDVLENEPPRNGSPLIGAPNCFITPHIAWQSTAARRRLIDICASNLAAFIDGNPINKVS